MLLPRLSQKEFAKFRRESVDILNGPSFSKHPAEEFIKAVEMFEVEDGKYVGHWLTEKIVDDILYKGYDSGFYPQQFLAASFECPENLVKEFGANTTAEFLANYPTPEDFIEAAKNSILTSRHHGEFEPKYKDVFKSRNPKFNYSNEEYSKMLKFLALCISGQIHEADWDRFWEVGERLIRRLNVRYNTVPNRSKSYLYKVIAKVFRGITGSEILKDKYE